MAQLVAVVTGEVSIPSSSTLQRLASLFALSGDWEITTDYDDDDDANNEDTGDEDDYAAASAIAGCVTKKDGETWCPMDDSGAWQRESDGCIYEDGIIRCPAITIPDDRAQYEYEYEYGDDVLALQVRPFRCMFYFLFYPLLCLGFLRLCRRMRQARRAREERMVRGKAPAIGKAPIVIECAVVVNASPVGKAELV